MIMFFGKGITILPKSEGAIKKFVSTSVCVTCSLSAIEIFVPLKIKFLDNSVLTPFIGVIKTTAFNNLKGVFL